MTLPVRQLGSSPVWVTELSFGAAPMAGLFTEVDEETAAAAVAAAWDGGIRAFDTAPHYGAGLSELRLGAALRSYPRDEYVVTTKVGRLIEPDPEQADTAGFAGRGGYRRVRDYSADGVRRSLEASLTRLGLDRADVVLIHDPDDYAEQALGQAYPALGQAYPALEELRAQGCVGAIGAGMNQSALLTRFVTDTDVDAVLVAGRYTLLDRSAGLDLLSAAAERGVSVVAAAAFNSGILVDPGPGATYDYEPASDELLARARAMEAVCARFGVPLRAAAARFPLRHPAVASVLIGMRSAAEVTDAITHWRAGVPDGLWAALEEGVSS